jgi:nitrate reductase delta subunit
MRAIKALGSLLLYPQETMLDALEEIREEIVAEPTLPREQTLALVDFITELQRGSPLDLQETYINLFDTAPTRSLYLFQHLYGDARERGRAMTDLLDLYRAFGYQATKSELPDYLPLFCELVGQLPQIEARPLLGTALPVFELMERRLAERGSAYASVFAALAALAEPCEQTALVAGLLRGHDAPAQSLDEAWAEPAVDFAAPVPGSNPGEGIPCAAPRATTSAHRKRIRQ